MDPKRRIPPRTREVDARQLMHFEEEKRRRGEVGHVMAQRGHSVLPHPHQVPMAAPVINHPPMAQVPPAQPAQKGKNDGKNKTHEVEMIVDGVLVTVLVNALNAFVDTLTS